MNQILLTERQHCEIHSNNTVAAVHNCTFLTVLLYLYIVVSLIKIKVTVFYLHQHPNLCSYKDVDYQGLKAHIFPVSHGNVHKATKGPRRSYAQDLQTWGSRLRQYD